ncbi:alpha/beta-hydrolase [Echria macrotheca]|uniref:Alpha/beta-hydrolase n=1 Tax=Echria macrotheca TaxID=438768 RepID=A0AAJ0F1L6_9PEZI|nr:alpha/beta-hydrolase [Echria macrotheca]
MSLLLLLLFTTAALAGPPSKPDKTCTPFRIPLNITAPYYNIDISIATNWDLSSYIFNASRRDSQQVFHPITSNQTLTTYPTIAATFCTPSTPTANSSTLLLLTHGSMTSGIYWDPPAYPQHSFVQHALAAGYSVFYYDRLGTGSSSLDDPISRVQYAPQVEILRQLTTLLRGSSSSSPSRYTPGASISKIVQVGHSFGAFLAASAIASDDDPRGDALVLTGFSGLFAYLGLWTTGGQARVAALQDPKKFGTFAKGYLVPADEYAFAFGGFKEPFFDRKVTGWLWERQAPFAIAELLTAGTFPLDFGKVKTPVQVVVGRYDLPSCGGFCDGLLNQTAALFTGAREVEVRGDFDGGHLLNYHFDGKKSFDAITGWIGRAI